MKKNIFVGIIVVLLVAVVASMLIVKNSTMKHPSMLIMKNSTEKEFNKFVQKYFDVLGVTIEDIDSTIPGFTQFKTSDGKWYTIGQTMNLKELSGTWHLVKRGSEYVVDYEWEKDGHCLYYIVYNKDKKFYMLFETHQEDSIEVETFMEN